MFDGCDKIGVMFRGYTEDRSVNCHQICVQERGCGATQ